MSDDIDVGAISEALNDKMDRDVQNVDPTVGKPTLTNMAMPSESFVDLTLGGAGDTYTAPADGYVQLSVQASASAWINAFYTLNGQDIIIGQGSAQAYDYTFAILFPVRKGMTFGVSWGAGTINTSVAWFGFRFIYAVGSEPQEE